MILGFERIATTGTVKDVDNITVPAKATGVEIMADTQDVRYTMDSATDPTATHGMLFRVTDSPKYFLVEDLKRIRFIQSSGGAGALNFHYTAGRDI